LTVGHDVVIGNRPS